LPASKTGRRQSRSESTSAFGTTVNLVLAGHQVG
jgi:hypothetical protein